MLKQLVLLAEREVKIKAQRAQRYARERRAAGHPSPGKAPHGYKWVAAANRDAKGTRYEIDKAEAKDVKRIFKEFLSGAPLGQIAHDLNSDGRKTRKGAKWHTSTVRRILMNPLYAALLPPSQGSQSHDLAAIDLAACTPGAWKKLIKRDRLVAARDRLVGVKPNHNGTARKWWLSGLAICSVCRQPVRSARGMTHPTPRKDGSGTPRSEVRHLSLRERPHHAPGRKSSTSSSRRRASLDCPSPTLSTCWHRSRTSLTSSCSTPSALPWERGGSPSSSRSPPAVRPRKRRRRRWTISPISFGPWMQRSLAPSPAPSPPRWSVSRTLVRGGSTRRGLSPVAARWWRRS